MKAWLSPSFPSALLKFVKNSARFHFALAIVLAAFTPALGLSQNITNPVPALEFSQYFRVGSGSVVTQRYTLSGPIGGERLYPGTRVARAGDSGYYFGTERQEVYMLNPRLGTFSGIPLGEISPEMAAQGWPTGVGYDATLGEVILVSLGGEGYIHTYSASTGWRLLASMGNWDFDNIEHHAKDDSYYGVKNSHVSSPGDSAEVIVAQVLRDGTHGKQINLGAVPFGVGFNDHAAELVSLGDYLVLLLEPGSDYFKHDFPIESRIYLIDPATGQSWLTYRKVWDRLPAANLAPTVEITSPVHPSSFDLGTTIQLRANAADQDGRIQKVAFYVNGELLGEGLQRIDATGNVYYELPWNPAPGTYTVRARATDNANATADSSAVSIAIQRPTQNFEMTFYPVNGLSVPGGQLFTREYTFSGPNSAGRLLPGMRMVPALEGVFYGIHWHEVFRLSASNGAAEKMTMSPGIEDLSWPMGVTFDTARNRLLLVSLGGEGFLYAYSLATRQWTVIASMENHDYDSILHHPESDQIFALESTSINRLNSAGQIVGSISLPRIGLHIGPGGYHTEMTLVDGKIALLIEPVIYNQIAAAMESRIYMIDIATGESELTYQKTWTAEPVNQVPTVQIVSPADGAHFLFGDPIQLRASASDLDGELRGLEFLANGSRIGAGVQENQTEFFSLQWNPQAPGPYLITAEAFDDAGGKGNSQSVGVTVHQPKPIVVSVRTVDPEAVEGPVDGSVDNAEFEISRSDDLLRDVTVYFSLHGTATPAVDYQSVSNFVRIPAGVANVRVTIAPIADRSARVENMETVVLRIEPVRTESAPVPPYTIDSQQREAAAVIYERSIPQEGKVEIALPSDGETFELGESIRILVAASSPTPITQVEFKANGQHIGTSDYNPSVGGGGFAIEAEDFDFDAGEHMPAADFMPYTGGAYEQVGAVHNVDFFRRIEVLEGDVYRVNESPNVPMLVSQEATNTDRGTWNVEVNYRLGWVDDGAWMNYTRNFPNGVYRLYAGLTHGDQNVTMRATLGKVTAGLGSTDQVVEPLGEFSGPGTGSWTTSRRVPLTSSGDEALVMLGGEQTLRFQGNTGDFDYLLLEPVTIAAPPRLIWHGFHWTNAPAGTNVISAEAVLPNGMRISTSAIRVRIGPEQRASFVLRDLPDSYSPGAPFTVTLRATPPPGTHAFAIEDSAPAGWVVSEISHDGVFDRVTGKVKFGPFTDSQGRDLSYRATPPTNASGRAEFVGSSSRDGVLYPIFGDQVIVGNSRFHPADRNQNSSVEIAELTAYAAAWKAGDSWPTGPSPILANYATRAGRLWRAGEAYRFETRIPAPLCWTPLNEFVPSGSIELVEAGRATAERSAASLVAPGETTDITVRIVPSVGSLAYAVEERIPAGWVVRFVSDGGIFDEVRRIVRWGVFLDSNPRTFTYSLSAPSNVTSVAALAGTVSIDGASMDVIGAGRIVGWSESTAVTLTPRHTNTGGVELRIDAAAGQTGVLESSTDLVNWVEILPVHNANGSVNVTNSAVGSDQLRFYRFKVQ